MDTYTTHQEALVAGALIAGAPNCTGIEFGIGYYSTPILHHLCGKHLLSIESDSAWLDKFSSFSKPTHEFKFIAEKEWYSTLSTMDLSCDFAFIDSVTGQTRVDALNLLKDKAKIVCIHDQENIFRCPGACYPGQIAAVSSYKYMRKFPHISCDIVTLLLSNFVSL